jgi:hypothetical protein
MIITGPMIDLMWRSREQYNNNFINQSGLIFDAKHFFDMVLYRDWVDIMVFTARPFTKTTAKFGIRRLLVAKLCCELPNLKLTKIRLCPNNHSKLYICYKSPDAKKPYRAFIGSLNLVEPTLHELMVEVTDKIQLKELKEYYQYTWDKCREFII